MDMLTVIKRVKTAEGGFIQMRIGLHTGEVIAGCIGTKQLRYDIWGADCLVANSMESNGIPSGIVVAQSTAE
jgi:class 3 adenylate cyclase